MPIAIVSQQVRRSSTESRWAIRCITQWHLLSLDAPSVAVAWLLLLNSGVPQRSLAVEGVALALAVWMIYVLDRLLDVRAGTGRLQQRHYFHLTHRRSLLHAFFVLLPVLVFSVAALPASTRIVWVSLGMPLAVYAACVHFFRRSIPKEFLVAVFFAVIVTTPSLVEYSGLDAVVKAVLLFALCWWNCLLIAKWEARSGDRPGPLLMRAVPSLLTVTASLCLLLPAARPAGVAGILSVVLLFTLDRISHRFAPVLLRSLGDAALLTPLLVFPFLHRSW